MSETTTAPAEQAHDATDDARPTDAPRLPATIDERPAFLVRDAPLIDTIPARWIQYLHATVAIAEDPKNEPITKAEIGVFIELCARYSLDPFAKEAWLAKSKRGKLLTLVGRDGLRRIAERNGLDVRGDVVHAKDDFVVEFIDNASDSRPWGEWDDRGRTPFHRVTHRRRGIGEQARGTVVGAWACVTERRTGIERGYFEAPLGEYKPAGASDYSVWSKQTSVMILGAAERTAIRQATPLGGLVAFGEHESAFARASIGEGVGEGQSRGLDLGPDVDAVLSRAAELRHAALADRGSVEMLLDGQPPEHVARWVAAATDELDAIPADAEVVTADLGHSVAQTPDPSHDATDGPSAPQEAAETGDSPRARRDPDAVERMRAQANAWLDHADSLDAEDKTEEANRARDDAASLMAEVDAASDENQIGLGL